MLSWMIEIHMTNRLARDCSFNTLNLECMISLQGMTNNVKFTFFFFLVLMTLHG